MHAASVGAKISAPGPLLFYCSCHTVNICSFLIVILVILDCILFCIVNWADCFNTRHFNAIDGWILNLKWTHSELTRFAYKAARKHITVHFILNSYYLALTGNKLKWGLKKKYWKYSIETFQMIPSSRDISPISFCWRIRECQPRSFKYTPFICSNCQRSHVPTQL